MNFHASEIADAIGGQLLGPDRLVTGITIDSRAQRPGQLFVALKGMRDGHSFIPQAVRMGAPVYLTDGPTNSVSATAIQVVDTTLALRRLGEYARRRLDAKTVGITGSVGKTTTKEMLKSICQLSHVASVTEQNFNNELGV